MNIKVSEKGIRRFEAGCKKVEFAMTVLRYELGYHDVMLGQAQFFTNRFGEAAERAGLFKTRKERKQDRNRRRRAARCSS